VIGFLIRLGVMLMGKYLFVLPHGDGDALVIEYKAYIYAYHFGIDYASVFSQGHNFLAYLFSFVYDIVGREEIVLNLIMVFLGTLLIKYIHDASYLIWKDKKMAIKIAWVAVFFPQFCLHSALLLREVPVNLCLLLCVISFIKYMRSLNLIFLIKFIFFTIFGMLFHSGIFSVFIGTAIFYAFRNRNISVFKKILMLSVIVVVIYLLNSSNIGLGKFGGSLDEGLDSFYLRESMYTSGGSAYPNWMRVTGTVSDIWKIPIRFITFLFAPLIPFLVKSPGHVLGLIDSIFYIYVFRKFYKNRKTLKNIEEYKFILTVILTLSLVFSLGVSNVGTAIRHRAKFAPLLLIAMLSKKQLSILKINK